MELEQLSRKHFEELVGDDFVATSDDGEKLHLKLIGVTANGEAPPEGREPFTLSFHEGSHAHLPQQTHSLEHDKLGTFPLFIVPLGPDPHGMRYEAVFG
jgi:hypothetical protein